MESMDWTLALQLSAFSGAAFILKYFLVLSLNVSSERGRAFLWFGIALLINNVCEFVGYLLIASTPEISKIAVHIYMVSLYFGMAFLVHFSRIISGMTSNALLLLIPAFILTGLHFSGFLIDGFSFNGYALIRIPGEYFFLFELYQIITSIAALIFLTIGANRKDSDIASRARIALLGLAPLCLFSIGITITMHFGSTFTSAIIVPVSTVLLVMVCRISTNNDILDMSIQLPHTLRIVKAAIAGLYTSRGTLEERIKELEKIYIDVELQQADNQQAACSKLGITEEELREKLQSNSNTSNNQPLHALPPTFIKNRQL